MSFIYLISPFNVYSCVGNQLENFYLKQFVCLKLSLNVHFFLDGNSENFGYCDEACDLEISVEETDGGFQLKLDVPSAFFKHIIGRKAETKRRLETETKTQIRIPKNGQDGPIGTVKTLLYK